MHKRHRWEGEIGSSRHESPHQARAFRRGLGVVTSAVCISRTNIHLKRQNQTEQWSV